MTKLTEIVRGAGKGLFGGVAMVTTIGMARPLFDSLREETKEGPERRAYDTASISCLAAVVASAYAF